MEIEKLMCHHSATKERINFGTAILFLIFFISLVIRREEWPTVEDSAAAAKAISELDGAEFFGRQMVVKEARPPKY